MKKISTLHTEWIKDADYRQEYKALAHEFAALIESAKNETSSEASKTHLHRERL